MRILLPDAFFNELRQRDIEVQRIESDWTT